ncbi:MAG: DNA mismatch repair endonuclease MutL [Candidatus Hydrothermales bacterium]
MKVKKLSKELIYRIRAGEVIEDPSSVVKELIENSLDAGAKRIHIYLEDGGKRLIEVKDDGEGMDEEDLTLSVLPFTSSKIEKVEDLKKITTYGFRGEALFAISKVSRLLIKSSNNESFIGNEIYLEGGERIHLRPCYHPKGTTVTVKEIFYSVPARRKFLKSSSQELKKIVELVTKYALSNPEVEFFLKNERDIILDLKPSSSFKDRLAEIFGNDYLKELYEIEENKKNYSFTLFISKPEFLKESPVKIFFVNKRPFYDNSFIRAFNTIYSDKLRYPDVFLFLFLNPEEVDFNVHPQKLQVKFSSKLSFPHKIVEAVRRKLKDKVLDKNKVELITNIRGIIKQNELPRQLEFGEMAKEEIKSNLPVYEDIWQLENTYIIVKFEKGLLVIDQHNAHEKIIYEKILSKRKFKTNFIAFPIFLKLSPPEFSAYREVKDVFKDLGFEIRELKDGEIQIEGIPEFIKKFTKENFIELINEIKKERKIEPLNVYKEIACKSAIKMGDVLKKEEMTNILIELFSLEDPFFCPHGRPVMVQITKDELDKKFGR